MAEIYIIKSCRINNKVEIEKYKDGRYGAPGVPREEKRKATPEEVARQNFWKRCQYLRRTMELNFKGGDLHVQLTCRKEERPAKEEAPKIIRAFRDKVQKEFKKQGWQFKYIITCETGKQGATHWHMICNNEHNEKTCTWDIIRKHWTRGRPHMTPLDDNRDYKALAEYIVKETKKRMDREQTIEKLSYTCSRNLIRPVERKKKVRFVSWKPVPKAPKGYYVLPDSIVNGINKFTGTPYQKYTIVELPPGKEEG